MSEPTKSAADVNAELVKSLQDILKKPEVRDHIKALPSEKVHGKKRPPGWKRTSTSSYYTEEYALQLKAVLDEMMIDGSPREFSYKDFPEVAKSTLYFRLYQSKLYLIDHLDSDGKYLMFLKKLGFHREKTGVLLELKRSSTPIPNKKVLSTAEQMMYREQLDEFLTDETLAQGAEFLREGLSLEDEEVLELRGSLQQLTNFVSNVTNDRIKVVKVE